MTPIISLWHQLFWYGFGLGLNANIQYIFFYPEMCFYSERFIYTWVRKILHTNIFFFPTEKKKNAIFSPISRIFLLLLKRIVSSTIQYIQFCTSFSYLYCYWIVCHVGVYTHASINKAVAHSVHSNIFLDGYFFEEKYEGFVSQFYTLVV